jgi:hypothetical protein
MNITSNGLIDFEPKQTNRDDLKAGDLVWVEKIEYGIDPKFIREPQEIESVLRVPATDDKRGYFLSIDIKGLPYMYLEQDVKLYKRK